MLFSLVFLAAAQTTTGGDIPTSNGQLFRPSIDATHTLWTDDTSKAEDGTLKARATAHYARDAVLYLGDDGTVDRLLGDLFQLNLTAGYTKGPIRLGVDLPVILRNSGDIESETGIGDVAFEVKGTLLDREVRPLGLALSARAGLPTNTTLAPLGAGGFSWEVQGIADRRIGRAVIAANIGVRGAPKEELENFDLQYQGVARVGGGYGFARDSGVSLDVASHIDLGKPVIEGVPVEAILGGWQGFGDLRLRGGVGTGLTRGFGAPSLRVLLGIGYEPRRDQDTDGDGVFDREDACPEEPEDLDGIADTDGCPEATLVSVRVVDTDGAPIPGATFSFPDANLSGGAGDTVGLNGGPAALLVEADGYDPSETRVTVLDQAEQVFDVQLEEHIDYGTLRVQVVDPDGVPIEGATYSIADGEERPANVDAEQPVGTYGVRATADGYRPKSASVTVAKSTVATLSLEMIPAKAVVTAERIEISDSVYFETGKAVIKPESLGLLDEVAELIVDHPELTKLMVEGHTDSRGSESGNLKLSKARASAVADYLIRKGVSADRLQSEGYGESRPLVAGQNEAAWSKNRRVDFFVAERADPEE